MYKCKDCGAVFEQPHEWYDDPSPSGIGLPSGCYIYVECPECGSGDFEEAEECPRCGAYTFKENLLCDDCREEFGIALRELKGRFGLDEDTLELACSEYFGW